MSRDLVEAYPAARQTFEQADAILGFSLSSLCFDGPEEALNDTYNTQPALFVSGIATLRALQAELPDAQPQRMAGHSLGEFTALAAAGALTFEDGLRLVRERGRLMKLAGEEQPGAMAAILGLDAATARDFCARASAETGGVLVLANDNCPGQAVISGDRATLERGLALAKESGARRAVPLAVSIAAHSPLMQPAADRFKATLQATDFQRPSVTVYGNTSAAPLDSVDAIRHELAEQLTRSVRWTETIQTMIAAGTTRFIEAGPKDVLTGLLKRIDGSASGIALNSADSIISFAQTGSQRGPA